MSAPRPSCVSRLVLVVLLGTATAVFGQPSATCDGSQELDGSFMDAETFLDSAPFTNDFTMTGIGCSEQGFDYVVCFTPQFDCNLLIDCGHSGVGATVSANIYQGACSTTPATCASSGSGSDFGSTSFAVTSGTHYCIVCETTVNSGIMSLDFGSDGGNCGAFPVEVQGFSISGSDAGTDGAAAETPTTN
jgi:hypothetical protein